MTEYKFLQPYTFKNGAKIKNRVVIPPMTEQSSLEDGTVSRDELYYMGMRSGGVGMFISPVAFVTDNGKGFEGELSAAHDHFIPSLTKLADTMKKNGTKAILQIFDAGRMSNTAILRGTQPVSASAVAAPREGYEVPRELSSDEIENIVKDFGEATRRAIQAGFDGVEIHGANTYLIQQFFSPHSNKRTDKWGGDVNKRMTFGLEVIKSVKAAVDKYANKDFIVGYRISPEEIENPGIRIDDTLQFIDKLADQPIDYLHISMGNAWRASLNDSSDTTPTILRIKEKVNGRLPLISVGSVNTPADAEKVMDAGIDFVAIGREYLREPKWIEKVQSGAEDTIRYTINRESLDEIGLNPALMSFLGLMGQDLGFEGEKNNNDDEAFSTVFK
ncbi:NADH-dependent flavin oxidoreductase [Companilactobacillus sp.]|jgi:2,4-dienoyl-CoA reductase-like NADH-dependent reductase (Old Yellow Enzyme family)|uniref:NADH-dependent flavin oxidoreductase n=1 Tax=Companilactobacillus sp. TaxID=2767905 RepID=UPI0025C6AC8D|nr:NADH-dependent flavin oxidoreductase [Companilactobacillus sp.]MCH4009162.1 NADH-dependent flavin oxidoreductase [Companilactobacillus sp.]MCH4050659.1 NADH-dependent flavin oxidoreductase [Companilactobacillus sp.]MCH4077104.1 NADH-dependent flavin oxidoreductase [Companilactobacillus sp.]MCH4125680.1 NADH-dependent flavin oxidoreductase [Companilactobacillus sp.]MCI1311389.1 NADH-dependent flavin oxidoreductase [Companilactobacillus sp.]